MDPLSIATGSIAVAKTAFNVALVLQSGIEAVKNVDATLQSFHGEVTALANALTLVGETCKNPKLADLDKNSLADDGRPSSVLQSLRGILSDCKETLARLDSLVQRASSKSQTSIFRRTSTALKLNFQSANVALIRQQIQPYTSAMQMTISLLTISIMLTHNELLSNNETIAVDLEAFQQHGDNLKSRIQNSELSNSNKGSNSQTSKLKDYLNLSQSIVSRAATVYGSETGSVIGDYMSAQSTLPIRNYPATRNFEAIETWRRNDSSSTSNPLFTKAFSEKRILLAHKYLKEQRYKDAEVLFKTCLSGPELEQNQVHEIRLALSLCYRGQNDLDMAAQTLLGLLNSEVISVMQESHVNRSLAEIYLEMGKAEEALPFALAACESYHSDSQEDEKYHDSCRLVAKVYRALDNFPEASLYFEEIPRESRYRSKVELKLYNNFFLDRGMLNGMSISSDGNQLAVSIAIDGTPHSTGEIELWTLPGCKERRLLGKHPGPVNTMYFTPDGRKLVSRSSYIVKIWESGQPIVLCEITDNGTRDYILSDALSPDGNIYATGTQRGSIVCRSLTGNGIGTTWEFKTMALELNSMSFSPDGSILALDTGKLIELREFPSWNLSKKLLLDDAEITLSLSRRPGFSPDGRFLASITRSGVEIWDIIDGTLKHTLKGYKGSHKQAIFSPDGTMLVTASHGEPAKVWDSASGSLLRILEGSPGEMVCFFPNGFRLLEGSWKGNLKLWSVEYD